MTVTAAVVQPVRAPGNSQDYVRLIRSGTLIDLGGRPLRWEPCPDCKGERTSGMTCPMALPCRHCGAKPRKKCKRPSEHDAAHPHKARYDDAEADNKRRAADGDLTVPAPWPAAERTPTMPAATKKTTRKPEPIADLFSGMADFAATVAGDLGLTDTSGPHPVPVGEVEWGTYGSVTGYGPTGDKRTEEGYITKLPRITTRGFSSIGRKAKRKGDELYCFSLDQPNGHGGGCSLGMFAEVDAVFTVLHAPDDRPLLTRKYLGRRMPAADLRRGDVFYIWDERDSTGPVVACDGDRRPRYHVQHDPTDIGGGTVALDLFTGSELITREMSADTYADVEDPRSWPWEQAHIITAFKGVAGWPGWYQWHCSCGETAPDGYRVPGAEVAVSEGEEQHGRPARAPKTQRPPDGSTSLRAGACGNPGDKHHRTIEPGDLILGVDVGKGLLHQHMSPWFAGTVVNVHQDAIELEEGEVLGMGEAPWVTIELDDGTERDFAPGTWFAVVPGARPEDFKPGQMVSWTNQTGQNITTTITEKMLGPAGIDVGWDITIPYGSLRPTPHEMFLDLAPGYYQGTYIVGCLNNGVQCWEFPTPVDAAAAALEFERMHLAKATRITVTPEERRKLAARALELAAAADTASVRPAAEPERTEAVGTAGDGLDDVRAVLARSTITGTKLALPSTTLPHTVWESVHKVMKAMGATGGSRKGQPYNLKSDRSADIAAFVAGGPAPLHEKKKTGLVPTPDELAASIVARFAEVGHLPEKPRVLEPSAGFGSLIRALVAVVPGARITAVEPFPKPSPAPDLLAKIPQVDPLHVCTFEDYARQWKRGREKPFDLVLMNPPYSVPGNRTLWADHVKLAWSMLAEGGRLVAIVPGKMDRTKSKQAAEILDLLGPDAMVELLPELSFRSTGADVDTCVVAATRMPTGVAAATARWAHSVYAPPVYEPHRAVRLHTELRLDAAAAVEMPNQVIAGFAGDVRVAYVGKCIACAGPVWTDENNDPRGFLGKHALATLWPGEFDLDGPEVIRCWGCSENEIMRGRALARAREMWTDPDCEPETFEELTLFSLDGYGEAVADAIAALD
jgi:hypothetical protein